MTRQARRTPPFRVLDMINTDHCAKELLEHRVAQVNGTGRYQNEICCSDGPYVERLRAHGHTVHVVNTPRSLHPVRLAGAIRDTYRLLRSRDYDIVHSHAQVVGLVARTAAWLAGTPVVLHQVHGFHHHDQMPPLKRWTFAQAERVLALLTDRLLFQHQGDVEECTRSRIAPPHKQVVIGNGIQLEPFDRRGAPQADPPILLSVCRLEPIKNHAQLLEAARILKSRGVRFVLQLAGQGALRARYEAHVRGTGLESCVEFLGYRDDIPALIERASICLLTSVKEGLPRALIEAAACARPVVATDVIGSREVVVDGVTGFLVPLHDAVALADRIERLLTNAELWRRMSEQARAHAWRQFDERVIAERILALYDEVLAPCRSGGRLEKI